jgi:hypothetical protein
MGLVKTTQIMKRVMMQHGIKKKLMKKKKKKEEGNQI